MLGLICLLVLSVTLVSSGEPNKMNITSTQHLIIKDPVIDICMKFCDQPNRFVDFVHKDLRKKAITACRKGCFSHHYSRYFDDEPPMIAERTCRKKCQVRNRIQYKVESCFVGCSDIPELNAIYSRKPIKKSTFIVKKIGEFNREIEASADDPKAKFGELALAVILGEHTINVLKSNHRVAVTEGDENNAVQVVQSVDVDEILHHDPSLQEYFPNHKSVGMEKNIYSHQRLTLAECLVFKIPGAIVLSCLILLLALGIYVCHQGDDLVIPISTNEERAKLITPEDTTNYIIPPPDKDAPPPYTTAPPPYTTTEDNTQTV